jgi:hypothetical protein
MLSSELISELEIPWEQDEAAAGAALPSWEARWEGTLESGLEEESDTEYSDEEVYLSEDDLDAFATASQGPRQKAFEVVIGKAY